MTDTTTVTSGGQVNPTDVGISQFTTVVSGTPPTSASGPIAMDRVGIDNAGNIWLMYPRYYNSAGVGSGGWTYAATVTSGGLPLAADASTPTSGTTTS